MGVLYDKSDDRCRDAPRLYGTRSDNDNMIVDTFMFVSSKDMEMLYNTS